MFGSQSKNNKAFHFPRSRPFLAFSIAAVRPLCVVRRLRPITILVQEGERKPFDFLQSQPRHDPFILKFEVFCIRYEHTKMLTEHLFFMCLMRLYSYHHDLSSFALVAAPFLATGLLIKHDERRQTQGLTGIFTMRFRVASFPIASQIVSHYHAT